MSTRFHRHPRFAELRDQFRAHPDCFTPWTGTLFRFHTVDYPKAKDVLSGKGAAWRGGRWNPPGLPTIYGSTTDTTALEECKANDRYYGVVTKSPRLLVAIEAQLTRALDLTDPRRPPDLGPYACRIGRRRLAKVVGGGKGKFHASVAQGRGRNWRLRAARSFGSRETRC
jgi:hypothetical protein